MNNDLISREALKKAIIEPLNVNDACKNDWYEGYYTAKNEDIMAIDNAQTVEPCYQTTSCLDCKNYDKANYNCPRFCEVIREIAKENQRPQGEWIDIDSLVSKAMCSNCKNIIITEPFGKPNYCPNCGADMREKDNQLRDCENCVHHSDNGCEVWECEFKRRSS